jgi:hypothetical protein
VRFVLGIDATKTLYELAGELPQNAWKTLVRRAKYVGDQINYPGRAQVNCLVRSQRGARRSLMM